MVEELRVAARPRFDPTINWGHVAIIVTWVFGFAAAYYAVKQDIGVIEYRLNTTERTLATVSQSLEKLLLITVADARQDERITNLDKRFELVEKRFEIIEGRVERVERRREPRRPLGP